MLASICFRSSLLVATRRPRLLADMSSEAGGALHDLIQSTKGSQPSPVEDEQPPQAPSGSFPVNPLTIKKEKEKTLGDKIKDEKLVWHLCWKSTRHNTVATLTDEVGGVKGWVTGGTCGFKHSRRGEYEAGYQCAVGIFRKIEERLAMAEQPFNLEILFKGFGQGRTALESVLMTSEGERIRPLLIRVTDRTPIKIGGTRARKARRL